MEGQYQQAVQVLQDRIGMRWDGGEAAGRDEMVRALTGELGFNREQAAEAIDSMIASGQLRYTRVTGDPSTTPDGAPPVVAAPGASGPAGAPSIAGFAGAPVTDPIAGVGYWQIGSEMSEAVGRKGQVDPT